MQRFVQIIELVDSKEAIEAYCKIHNDIWHEIVEGIRFVGIDKMDIYLRDNTAVMIIEIPDEINFDSAMAMLATLPRQQEWEEFVGRYQKCTYGSTSAGKWKRMTQIFELPEM